MGSPEGLHPASPLLLATRNRGKAAEYRALLAGIPFELRTLDDVTDAPAEPPEDAPTYAENAARKALTYAQATGLLAIADDSGLEVEAFGGEPGVRTRRYFGEGTTDEERNRRLLALLADRVERGARFVCAIALAWPDGRLETFEGVSRGRIADAPRALPGLGFGYDPVFVPEGETRTFAELGAAEKHRVSHRGRAARLLRDRLGKLAHTDSR